jgi:hypothetical protein
MCECMYTYTSTSAHLTLVHSPIGPMFQKGLFLCPPTLPLPTVLEVCGSDRTQSSGAHATFPPALSERTSLVQEHQVSLSSSDLSIWMSAVLIMWGGVDGGSV